MKYQILFLVPLLIGFSTADDPSPISNSSSFSSIIPLEKAQLLLHPPSNGSHLLLLFTGDTQYYYPCTLENLPCREYSKECHQRHHAELEQARQKAAAENGSVPSMKTGSDGQIHFTECTKLESAFANEMQRKSINDLYRMLSVKPSELIVNGDLTNYGHMEQLNMFKVR